MNGTEGICDFLVTFVFHFQYDNGLFGQIQCKDQIAHKVSKFFDTLLDQIG
jgi:hypothetical protein